MNIAFIVSQFPVISESFIVQQITGLLEMGHNVQIVSFRHSQQKQVQKEVQKYNLVSKTTYICIPDTKIQLRFQGFICLLECFLRNPRATINLLSYFRTIKGFLYSDLFLARFFLRNSVDVVHAHFGPNGLQSLCTKRMGLHSKHITSFHGYDVSVYIQQNGTNAYRQLFALGDRFTYNSQATKDKLVSLGCPLHKMIKLPMGINLKAIPFKERTLLPGEKIRLLSVGRLVEMKGREYAIKAIAQIKGKYNIHYDIVGDGPLRDDLKKLVTDLGLDDIIQFRGWTDSETLERLYSQAHLFIHPSITSSDGNQEGQGVVLLEAQAYGIPVIATRHGAFPDSLLDGQSGFLVPEKDVEALADKIEFLIANPQMWPQLGRTGRRFIEEQFDAAILNKRLEEIYAELL
jgi:colanic acid/amylovoran biosynthesis glycosyltransferase